MSILQTTIDKYEIKLLMHEGQGIRVYKASVPVDLDTASNSSPYVVIKQAIHDKNTQSSANANIRHQIQILEKLKKSGGDTGFVKLLASGQDENDCAYFVMPKYEQTLTRFLQQRDANIDAIVLLDWISALSKSVNELHKIGFTHNDLKPDNLLLTSSGELIISDLGAAQTLNRIDGTTDTRRDSNKTGNLGTPAFASPELLYATRPVSNASDFYSIGKIAQYIVDAAQIDVPTQLHEFIVRLTQENIEKRLGEYIAIESIIEGLRQSLDDNRTQVLSDTWLTEKYASLYQKVLLMLSQNGQLSEADESFLQNTYLGNMQAEQSSTILSSIIKCARNSLCKDPNMRDWLMWCETLNMQLAHRANRLTNGEFLAMTDDGIRLSKRNRYQVEAYIRKRAKIIGSTRKRYWALAFVLIAFVFCTLYFYEFSPSNQNHDIETNVESSDSTWRNTSSESSPSLSKTLDNKINKPSSTTTSLTDLETSNSEVTKRLRLQLGDGDVMFIDVVKIQTITGNIWVMQNEVSIALYNACIDAGSCRKIKRFTTQSRALNQIEDSPVTNVSWFDVTDDFIPYINRVFSAHFRLPTLSEWQAMSLSDVTTTDKRLVNIHCKNCKTRLSEKFNDGPMPVNLLAVDDKNLRHVYGNVQEWLDECPLSKDDEPLCYQAIVVGGSWMHTVDDILNHSIGSLQKRARSINTGFRLVESEK